MEQRLSGLIDAGLTLASELELDVLLQRIADLSRQVIGASYGAVGVISEEGELIRFVHSGVSEETVHEIGHLPTGEGVLGAIIEEGRPLRLREISDHARSVGFPEHHPVMRSFLGVPIVSKGQVYGRLYLTEKKNAPEFTKDDERIALLFASQASVALENARLYEEVRQRGDELARRMAQMASVEQVGTLLVRGRSIDETLDLIVQESVKLTGGSRGTLMLVDDQTGDLIVRHAAGDETAPTLVGVRLSPDKSKAGTVMRRFQGEIVENLSLDQEISAEAIERLGMPESGAFAPLVIRGRAVGTLAVYHDRSAALSPDDLAMIQILANHAAIALQNEQLTEAMQDLAVLEERDRISKELHDGVIQAIYSVGLSLQSTTSLVRRDPDRVLERIDQAINQLDDVVRDVRSYIFELQPKSVEEKGLVPALRELVRDLEVNTLANAKVELDEKLCESLNGEERIQVIQVVREILANIARHAQAQEVNLYCSERDGHLVLTIEDDGLGFDPLKVERGDGLQNIEDRAAKLGGTIEIAGREPRGTRTVLRFPRTESVSPV